jgi:KUP system potassium uptake protein
MSQDIAREVSPRAADGLTAAGGEAQGTTPADAPEQHHKSSLAAMAVGSIGVVYGDIGTSPLYALRESLAHSKTIGLHDTTVIGTVSLLVWALFFTVTAKYVLFLMRADNTAEGIIG